MTEVLLKELSYQDSDWLFATGHQMEIEAGTVLMQQGQPIASLYILLRGTLKVSLAQSDDHPLGQVFAVLEGGKLAEREIAQLGRGEIVGEMIFWDTYLPSTTVRAVTPSLVLQIPRSQLLQKLQLDEGFAARFYRASAVSLANRLEQTINHLGYSTVVLSQPQLREALIMFVELHDSDIDWLIAAGRVQQLTANTVFIQSGRPIEALHILLDGVVSLTSAKSENNLLAQAFSHLENTPIPEREFARLSRGDILGGTPFIDAKPSPVTVKALQDSWVLSVPRWRLAAKLLHDVTFAARFYKVLAILLADKQQTIEQRLGYGRLTYSSGQSLEKSYANELNSHFLSQMTLAGARFEWMLKQVQM